MATSPAVLIPSKAGLPSDGEVTQGGSKMENVLIPSKAGLPSDGEADLGAPSVRS